MEFLQAATRNLFYTGKGGVGKTSIACASAIELADRGLRVLLVSTDPASNLDEVLGARLSDRPRPIAAVANLDAMNIDPEAAARKYRDRMVEPYRGVLPSDALRSMEEQFSGSCTLEIAAFDEFARLLGDDTATNDYQHVLFDTAPTGHTLRLLKLPSAWSTFLDENKTGTSCLGPLSGLKEQQSLYVRTVNALCDSSLTTLVLVTRPEETALREAARTSVELRTLGVDHQHLIVNGVFPDPSCSDEVAIAMRSRCDQAIREMPASVRSLPATTIPLSASPPMGIDALRRMASSDSESFVESEAFSGSREQSVQSTDCPDGLMALIDELAAPRRGVILAMGKGGVGKTTVASAIALALAERGHRVHLATTDPATHLESTLSSAKRLDQTIVGDKFTMESIDPEEECANYRKEVMTSAGSDLDDSGRALLEEDLRSPCTEEIAVFRAFARTVAQGEEGFVVLDTAPTGHTILLLDAALSHQREVSRQANQMPESIARLLPRLRDPEFTRVLVVTLPAATPVHEAAKLQEELRRAEIEPFAWVINQSLLPIEIRDLTLQSLRSSEQPFVREVEDCLAKRVALIPWQVAPPIGLDRLRQLISPNKMQTTVYETKKEKR